jgi:DnaJ like chaperone protein
MKWIGKAAGGVIGALVLGPLGAALGLLLGHQFDEDSAPANEPLSHEDLTALGERFFRATFRVMGYLAKADGRVSELEIAAARAVMSELRLNAAQTQEAIACFTAGKQPQFDCDGEPRRCSALPRTHRPDAHLPRDQVRAALAGNNLEGRVRAMMQRVAQRLEPRP